MDWHSQLHQNERRQVMARVAQALRQAQPNYAPQQIAQVAQNFGMSCLPMRIVKRERERERVG